MSCNDGTVTCQLRIPGQYEDNESGLFYNRHRYYDPETAQYLSPDPIGLMGGINPYGYVHNPTGWVDPLGLVGYCNEGKGTKLEINPNKFDYLYGKVNSEVHNTDRSTQLAQMMRRLGLQTNESGTATLTEHFNKVVNTEGNVIDTYKRGSQSFEVRESFLMGLLEKEQYYKRHLKLCQTVLVDL